MKNSLEGHHRLRRAVRAAIAGTAVLATPCAFAATITVDSAGDGMNDNECTLRSAIMSANNNNSSTGACAGGAGDADTIIFAESVTGETITLAQGALPTIVAGSSLTIGNDADTDVTIDANSMSRILANQGVLTLNGLNLINGQTMNG